MTQQKPLPYAMKHPAGIVACLLLGASLFCCVSCKHDARKPVYPVVGKVLFRGTPAEGATVTLHPLEVDLLKTPKPGAQVQKNGEFRLSTYQSYDGAPPGRYAVTIVYPSPERKENDENVGPDLLQGRYADPKTTPLKVEIKEQTNDLATFNVK
jgi:hypothetical protein